MKFFRSSLKKESVCVPVTKRIVGAVFLAVGALGVLATASIFLVLSLNPSSSWLKMLMVDFRPIDVMGFVGYYLFLTSGFLIVTVPLTLVFVAGKTLFFNQKRLISLKIILLLLMAFFVSFSIFYLLSENTERKFNDERSSLKGTQVTRHYDLRDFDAIKVSRYVEYDDITVRQGDVFDVTVKGSAFDHIGLSFEVTGDRTLLITRSEMETKFNTDTWTVENRYPLYPAGTKQLNIEITLPDLERVSLDGGNFFFDDIRVDNLTIDLNGRFINVKGEVAVEDTLKINAKGGIIDIDGFAKNLTIDSGDCWIEMDKLMAENAVINARNTSRLNVNVSQNMEIWTNENSGIVNHY